VRLGITLNRNLLLTTLGEPSFLLNLSNPYRELAYLPLSKAKTPGRRDV